MLEGASKKDKAVPAAYAAFASLFAQLDASLLEILSGLLAAMERQFPLPSETTRQSAGDIDGLGGIAQRGEISQLLQSELLLRTEAPLEFLRRISEREALYNEWQFSDPGQQRVLRAVVSTGPCILGHGRLVSLAGLFYLAVRAQRLGETFHWTFLPRSEGPVWFDELTVNSIKRYLKAGAAREYNDHDFNEALLSWQAWAAPEVSLQGSKVKAADWIIGGAEGGEVITQKMARHLNIRFDPAVRGEPRRALVDMMQPNGLRHTARIVFPDDEVCLSALQSPFSPLRPTYRRGGGSLGPMRHWEPLYFTGRNSDAVLVRTKEGLLLLRDFKGNTFKEAHYLELPEHIRLAGAQLLGDEFHYCLWRPGDVGGSKGQLVYGRVRLSSMDAPAICHVVDHVPETFFANQPAFSLPIAFVGRGLDGFTALGRHMRVLPGGALQLEESFIYYVSGSVRIRSVEKEQADVLVAEQDVSRRIANFSCEELRGKIRQDLWGMSFNHSACQLAYSLAQGEWRVPNRHGRKIRSEGNRLVEEQSSIAIMNTLPSDRLLRATARGMDVTALVWSDPSVGGDGHLYSLRSVDGKSTERNIDFRFLESGNQIAKVDHLNDGSLWAIWVDAAGAPEWFGRINRKGRNPTADRPGYIRQNLRQLQNDATPINLGGLLG